MSCSPHLNIVHTVTAVDQPYLLPNIRELCLHRKVGAIESPVSYRMVTQTHVDCVSKSLGLL